MLIEYDYVIKQAVDAFNKQFSRTADPATFAIEVLERRHDGNFAFEVYTLRTDDHFRLRLYFKISNLDSVGAYRLETRSPHSAIPETIEVYSALATVDKFHFENKTFSLEPFLASPAQVDFLIQLNNQPFLMENGSFIELEA